jgi:hypothetical protein
MAKRIVITLMWGVVCAAAGVCSAQEAPAGPSTSSSAAAAALPKIARDGIRLVEDKQFRPAIEYLVRASNEGSKAAIIEEYLVTAYLSVPPSARESESLMRRIAAGLLIAGLIVAGPILRLDASDQNQKKSDKDKAEREQKSTRESCGAWLAF